MPLPLLIPILLGSTAVVGGAVGAIKGLRAKGNFDAANALREQGDAALASADAEFQAVVAVTRSRLENLAEIRLRAHATLMNEWVHLVRMVQGAEVNAIGALHMPDVGTIEVKEVADHSAEAIELLGGAVTSVASGFGVTTGVTGLVTAFGSASSGTAISALSGASATNATAAWFGGGSLAAGGLGVAGGTMVMSGIGVGVVALMAGSKAETLSKESLALASEAHAVRTTQAAEIKEMTVQAQAIATRADEVAGVTTQLGNRLAAEIERAAPMLQMRHAQSELQRVAYEMECAAFARRNGFMRWLLRLLGRAPRAKPDPLHYDNMTPQEKTAYEMLVAMGMALYPALKIELLDETGALKRDDHGALDAARTALLPTEGAHA